MFILPALRGYLRIPTQRSSAKAWEIARRLTHLERKLDRDDLERALQRARHDYLQHLDAETLSNTLRTVNMLDVED